MMDFVSKKDPLYDEALDVVVKASVIGPSALRKRLYLGYTRARNLINHFVEDGLIVRYSDDGGVRYKLTNK